MSAMKYYICNNIMFLGGNGKMVDHPSSAIRYKSNAVPKYSKARDELVMMRLFNCSNGKNFVMATPAKFCGNDNNITSNIKAAKSFSSIDEARDYYNIFNISDIIPEAKIIDSSYHKHKIRIPDVTDSSIVAIEDAVEDNDTAADAVNPSSINENKECTRSPRIQFSHNVRQRVFSKYEGICQICGKPVEPCQISIDHIIPLSKGGTNDESNLQLTHDFCNKTKGAYTMDECVDYTSDITSRWLLDNPDPKIINKLARSIVRGVNKNGFVVR